MILDIDTTYDKASSNLHGANFNTHYQTTGFSPLLCFDGMTGDLIKGDLRPGNTYCSKNSEKFLSPLLREGKEIFFEAQCKAKSWDKKRRILCKMQWKGDSFFPVYSAIVTNNLRISPKKGFDFYNQRAVIENYIEEGKNGFSWDYLSHKGFNQNRAKFQVFLLAYQVTNFFKRFCVPLEKEKSSIQTLRIMEKNSGKYSVYFSLFKNRMS